MKDALEKLNDLRWSEDRIVINPFGERVWLKKRDGGGITDCCYASNPCDRHASCDCFPWLDKCPYCGATFTSKAGNGT